MLYKHWQISTNSLQQPGQPGLYTPNLLSLWSLLREHMSANFPLMLRGLYWGSGVEAAKGHGKRWGFEMSKWMRKDA